MYWLLFVNFKWARKKKIYYQQPSAYFLIRLHCAVLVLFLLHTTSSTVHCGLLKTKKISVPKNYTSKHNYNNNNHSINSNNYTPFNLTDIKNMYLKIKRAKSHTCQPHSAIPKPKHSHSCLLSGRSWYPQCDCAICMAIKLAFCWVIKRLFTPLKITSFFTFVSAHVQLISGRKSHCVQRIANHNTNILRLSAKWMVKHIEWLQVIQYFRMTLACSY